MDAQTWEIEVAWTGAVGADPRAADLGAQIDDWAGGGTGSVEIRDLYWIESNALDREFIERASEALLSDAVTQSFTIRDLGPGAAATTGSALETSGDVATILSRVGVMDPVESSLKQGLSDLASASGQSDSDSLGARTGVRVLFGKRLDDDLRRVLSDRVLCNQAIQEVYWNDQSLPAPFTSAQKYEFDLQEVKLDGLSDEELDEVSRTGQLSLSRREMQTIRDHFQSLGRAPTDIELETIAQTWSEHCCHKTLTAKIAHERPGGETLRFENLLKETIGRATNELMAKETEEFCLSVFVDNAGVVAFDDEYGLSFKVETHNHPSAIEPYGGAGTGIGGVLRDTLGTGLGAKPIVNTDVFCVGPIDTPKDEVPPGVLHPKRVLRGIVGGVRDYGNRMGIPTASGALYFDERYTTNPLVFCGSVGLIPRDAVEKDVQPGDRVVVMGGRTGRDGIHGATFSSIELSEESETVSSGAVQIGNAITEKKCLDVLLEARDRRLFRGVTDCGAGGLSSAVGEMGEKCGARVDLDTVPLKYEGLNYWEIWISEAQERMVFAVPPECKDELFALAASEDVECTDLGEFTDTGRLELFSHGERVADLSMAFLHDGRPVWTRESRFEPRASAAPNLDGLPAAGKILHSILAAPNVASKEWVVRQYDHEVQGRSVLKPFQGPGEGPGDGVAFTPRLDSRRGVVIGCGMNPCYGDLDPYRMALSAIDESMRNVVAAGGDPDHTAILDNFCWGNTDRPETLGTIVEAAIGCRDGALALGTPFISGKDSLNNEYRVGDEVLSIPSTLLISSMSIVPDVRRLVSMDAKKAGNKILLVGETKAELGGSHLLRVSERDGGEVPDLPSYALDTHRAMHAAVKEGLVQSIHDLSEGGLAVAGAEMAFSGGVGIELRLDGVPRPADLSDDLTILFSESNSRYLVEVCPEDVEALCSKLGELPFAEVGETIEYGIFRVVGLSGETTIAEPLAGLADSWRTPIIDQPEPTNAVS